jgi:nuclear pore complex protein Nup205
LDEHVNRAEETIVALDKIAGMLENVDAVRLEEWDQVIAAHSSMAEIATDNLQPNRRKAIAVQLLDAQRRAQRAELRGHLNCIEILLVLLFRHFGYYIELGRVTVRSKMDVAGGMPFVSNAREDQVTFSAAETAALIRDGGKITAKVLEKLDGMVSMVDSAHGIADADERKAYVTMTARRLQSVLLENADNDV